MAQYRIDLERGWPSPVDIQDYANTSLNSSDFGMPGDGPDTLDSVIADALCYHTFSYNYGEVIGIEINHKLATDTYNLSENISQYNISTAIDKQEFSINSGNIDFDVNHVIDRNEYITSTYNMAFGLDISIILDKSEYGINSYTSSRKIVFRTQNSSYDVSVKDIIIRKDMGLHIQNDSYEATEYGLLKKINFPVSENHYETSTQSNLYVGILFALDADSYGSNTYGINLHVNKVHRPYNAQVSPYNVLRRIDASFGNTSYGVNGLYESYKNVSPNLETSNYALNEYHLNKKIVANFENISYDITAYMSDRDINMQSSEVSFDLVSSYPLYKHIDFNIDKTPVEIDGKSSYRSFALEIDAINYSVSEKDISYTKVMFFDGDIISYDVVPKNTPAHYKKLFTANSFEINGEYEAERFPAITLDHKSFGLNTYDVDTTAVLSFPVIRNAYFIIDHDVNRLFSLSIENASYSVENYEAVRLFTLETEKANISVNVEDTNFDIIREAASTELSINTNSLSVHINHSLESENIVSSDKTLLFAIAMGLGNISINLTRNEANLPLNRYVGIPRLNLHLITRDADISINELISRVSFVTSTKNASLIIDRVLYVDKTPYDISIYDHSKSIHHNLSGDNFTYRVWDISTPLAFRPLDAITGNYNVPTYGVRHDHHRSFYNRSLEARVWDTPLPLSFRPLDAENISYSVVNYDLEFGTDLIDKYIRILSFSNFENIEGAINHYSVVSNSNYELVTAKANEKENISKVNYT